MSNAGEGLPVSGTAQKQVEKFETSIAPERKERPAVDATVNAVTVQRSKLTKTGRSLEQVNTKAVTATGSLDVFAKRIEELERTAGPVSPTSRRKRRGLRRDAEDGRRLA